MDFSVTVSGDQRARRAADASPPIDLCGGISFIVSAFLIFCALVERPSHPGFWAFFALVLIFHICTWEPWYYILEYRRKRYLRSGRIVIIPEWMYKHVRDQLEKAGIFDGHERLGQYLAELRLIVEEHQVFMSDPAASHEVNAAKIKQISKRDLDRIVRFVKDDFELEEEQRKNNEYLFGEALNARLRTS